MQGYVSWHENLQACVRTIAGKVREHVQVLRHVRLRRYDTCETMYGYDDTFGYKNMYGYEYDNTYGYEDMYVDKVRARLTLERAHAQTMLSPRQQKALTNERQR